MILKEFFVKLGLDTDGASFAKGQLAVNALQFGLGKLAELAQGLFAGAVDSFIGFNANAEKMKMSLAGIAGLNLKLPWEDAKKAADELYRGLQEDAAKTPAETQELVEFSTEIANNFLQAGKSMQDLRQFTTQAVVAAKMLKLEGTAALDITQALSKNGVGEKDRFALTMVKSQGLTKDQFNAKSISERADILARAFNSPTIQAAMKEYENNWDGVTSTLKDNVAIILGEVGKPLFEYLKDLLGSIGTWVQENKADILGFFQRLVKVFQFFWGVLKFIARAFGGLVLLFKNLYDILGPVLSAIIAITAAMTILGVTSIATGLQMAAAWLVAAAPVLAMVAALALIALVLEDIYVGLTGGRSVIGGAFAKLGEWLTKWTSPDGDDPWWLAAIKAVVQAIFNLDGAWADAVRFWKEVFTDFGNWVVSLFDGIWTSIKAGIRSVGDALNPFNGESVFTKMAQQGGAVPAERNLGPLIRNIAPTVTFQNVTVNGATGKTEDIVAGFNKIVEDAMETLHRKTLAAVP